MIILPEGVPARWQQAISRDHYLEWLSYSTYLRAMSRLACSDNSFAIGNDLLFLSQIAHQRALDLEPVRESANEEWAAA